jgi:hypothetical protein
MLAGMTSRPVARRRHPWRTVLIVVLVLAGLLVVADRAALAVAERAAAVTVQKSQHLDRRPSVTIAGFPFLTQLATGHYDKVKVRAEGFVVGDSQTRLRINRVDVTLRDVHVSRDFSSGRSRFTEAQALIGYSDLSDALGTRFRYAGGGRVDASSAVTVAGVDVSGSATASVRLSNNALTFEDPQVSVEGQPVPAAVANYFTGLFATSIPLTGLPFGVHVQDVHAGRDGITVVLTASGLSFSR